jgi:hypothetical protein
MTPASLLAHLRRADAYLSHEPGFNVASARHEIRAVIFALEDGRMGCPQRDERCPWAEGGRNLCQRSAEEQAPRE